MKLNLRKYVLLLALLSVFTLTPAALGQSTDQALPTPVMSNEISGEINALDLGDPRLTRHFYAFEGSPGDLLITVESKNLNGDIDVHHGDYLQTVDEDDFYCISAGAGDHQRHLPAS